MVEVITALTGSRDHHVQQRPLENKMSSEHFYGGSDELVQLYLTGNPYMVVSAGAASGRSSCSHIDTHYYEASVKAVDTSGICVQSSEGCVYYL